MSTRSFDFSSMLASLRYNISRSRLPIDDVAITQIRQLFAEIGVSITINTETRGPLYYLEPNIEVQNLILGNWKFTNLNIGFDTGAGSDVIPEQIGGAVVKDLTEGISITYGNEFDSSTGIIYHYSIHSGIGSSYWLGPDQEAMGWNGEDNGTIVIRFRDSSGDTIRRYMASI